MYLCAQPAVTRPPSHFVAVRQNLSRAFCITSDGLDFTKTQGLLSLSSVVAARVRCWFSVTKNKIATGLPRRRGVGGCWPASFSQLERLQEVDAWSGSHLVQPGRVGYTICHGAALESRWPRRGIPPHQTGSWSRQSSSHHQWVV